MTLLTMLPENPLQLYGVAIKEYRGNGQLTLSTKRKVACEFAAGQLETGETILLCATQDLFLDHLFGLATADLFKGTTTDGDELSVDHVVSETNYLPEESAPGAYTALRVGHLRVCSRTRHSRRRLSFLLTNLSGIQTDTDFTYQGLNFRAQPLGDSALNLKRLQVLRGVLPTVALSVPTRASLQRVTNAVDELCYLLSVAVGTKVQWVALSELSATGAMVCEHHYSRVTKRYGALHALDPRGSDIASFLERCGDGVFTHARQRSGLANAVINTYLDAKSEGDFLQVRALKLVVAVEMLKAAFSESSGTESEVLRPDVFDGLLPQLKAAVKDIFKDDASADQRKAFYANLFGLNRAPFSWQLRRLCETVHMQVTPGEIEHFVSSRNKLVHEGRFYCERATDKERKKVPPLPTLQAEWFWLLHFVDRLFLRAIDYEGTYIDWSVPGEPVPRHLGPAA